MNVTIFNGIKISHGSVVGANSTVTRDFFEKDDIKNPTPPIPSFSINVLL
jgi:carbonic anhydrase/acetyltransferase-like protein (isoleucine patch superfamily)